MKHIKTRSGLETKVLTALRKQKLKFIYEPCKISYIQPEMHRLYTPDIRLESYSFYLEIKGRLTRADRKKLEWIKLSNPNLDLRILFANAETKLAKGSPTRYRDWADKHGFLWSDLRKFDGVPEEWLI